MPVAAPSLLGVDGIATNILGTTGTALDSNFADTFLSALDKAPTPLP